MGKYGDAHSYGSPTPPPSENWDGPPGQFFYDTYSMWPPVPGSAGSDIGIIQVSTDALKVFAGNLRRLIPPLEQIRTSLRDLEIAPGVFYDAYNLQVKVLGAKGSSGTVVGLVPATLTFLDKAIYGMSGAADKLEEFAARYKTTEELNAATGKSLLEIIDDAKTYITDAISSPATQ